MSAGQRTVVLHSERKYKPHQRCDIRVGRAVAFYSTLEVSVTGSRNRCSTLFRQLVLAVSCHGYANIIKFMFPMLQYSPLAFPDYYIGPSNRKLNQRRAGNFILDTDEWKILP